MDINEKDVPQKMDDDLSKIAYNIVPDGAEYDVFSENVKKNEKGVLLFDDVSSPDSNNKKAGAEIKQKSGASSAESTIKSKLQSKAVSESADKNDEAEKETVGMEYDVFSENIKKSENGMLFYNDISSGISKNTEAGAEIQQESSASSAESTIKSKLQSKAVGESADKNDEAEKENVGMEYDVFSENADPDSASKKPINREYLDRFFDGGIEFSEDTIVMKRSDYIAAFNRIEEDFRNAKKECLKDLLWVLIIAAFSVLLYNFLKYLQGNIMSILFTNLLTMAVIACELASRIVCAFLFISIIIKNIKVKKARQKALDRLEKRKEELMLMGLYDLSN